MESIPGYDAWRLASPPEGDDSDRCDDCRGQLEVFEIGDGLCAQCIQDRDEEAER